MTRARAPSPLAPAGRWTEGGFRAGPGGRRGGGLGGTTREGESGRPERRRSGRRRVQDEPLAPSPLPAWVLLGLALSLLLPAEGFVLQVALDCPLSAQGRLLGANWTLAFNKMPFVCYSHDYQEFIPCGLGGFPGWSQVAGNLADYFSRQFPTWGRASRDLCQEQAQRPVWAAIRGRHTPPNVRIFPITPQNTPAPVMLTCEVWGFYPADVAVTWLRNGAFVKNSSGVAVVSNGDWTHQTRLSLPVYPQSGETYTCQVDHASLLQPLTQDWEPGLTPELKMKVGVSGAVLGVGLIFLIAGLVCWKKRVPEGYVPIDGDNYPPVGS